MKRVGAPAFLYRHEQGSVWAYLGDSTNAPHTIAQPWYQGLNPQLEERSPESTCVPSTLCARLWEPKCGESGSGDREV